MQDMKKEISHSKDFFGPNTPPNSTVAQKATATVQNDNT